MAALSANTGAPGAGAVHIRSVGTALPGPPVDNATLGERLRMPGQWEEWVETFIGTRTRHLAIDLDSGKPAATLADLCETAGRRALDRAGLAPEQVDLVVMGTASPDDLMPATINVVADRLRINGVPTYQLQSGCTGAFQAMHVAQQLLSTGAYRNALVLGGDVTARFYDFDVDFATLPPEHLVHYVLFGDGAGALVLDTQPVPGSLAVRRLFTQLTGLDRAPGQTVHWFGPSDRDSTRPPAEEDYKAIEESVPVMAAEILDDLLDEAGWDRDEVDFLLPPQLSGRMTTKIVDLMALPAATEVSCVRDVGNNGNATPFFQLEQLLAQITPGSRAVGVSVESSKWIKAGFAVEMV
ncbi:3-oxoacyl-ACP synthase III family protein [Streptomyces sp. NBC_00433]